jgi:hypothetical protein
MEPLENDDLSDLELDRILNEWKTPAAPARLRTALFPQRAPWWRAVWTASVRVPAPALCVLALLILLAVLRSTPRASEPVGGLDFNQWQPVAELRPKVIRSGNVPN